MVIHGASGEENMSSAHQIVSSPDAPADFVEVFHRDGFVVIPRVFTVDELEDAARHVSRLGQPPRDELARYGANPFPLQGKSSLQEMTPQELKNSERFIAIHLFDDLSRRLMLDPRLFGLVRALWPGEPLAVHGMYFPKPPGCRGMALHSDTGCLPVEPPDLAGCLVAVDDMDEENGALQVALGSHRYRDVPWHVIPKTESVFHMEFERPAQTPLVLNAMKAGDVLLFHGSTLHSSAPNRSTTRWRRAFTFHYVSAAVREVSEHFNPAFRANGEEIPAPGHTVTANGLRQSA